VEVAEAIAPLADEWDDLARRAGAPPFSRPGWVQAWWSAFGQGSLAVLTLRRDGELAAVLPLARHRRVLRSCSNVHTPVFDCVAARGEDAAAMLEAAVARFDAILLEQIDAEGRLAEAVRSAAGATGSRLVLFEELVNPYVAAGMSREEYESALGSSKRQQVRRKRRRLSDLGELTYEASESLAPGPELEERFEQLLRLEGSGWKASAGTAIGSRPETRRFYAEVATWAAEEKLLRLSFMRLEGRPVVGWLLIGDEARQYSIKTGYDEQFSRFSPGVLLALEEIGHALDGGRSFELGAGMNRLKQDLHNAAHTLEHVGVFRRTPAGALARWRLQGKAAVYRRARQSSLLRRVRDALRRRLARD